MSRGKTIVLLTLAGLLYTASPAFADVCDVEKTFDRGDKHLFGKHCGFCHSMTGKWQRNAMGPPLGALFQKGKLVTGKPATDENVRDIIMQGGPRMPGFQHMFTPAQVNEVIRYLKETRCPNTP